MIAVRELLDLEPVGGFYQQLGGDELRARGVFLDGAEVGKGVFRNDSRGGDELRAALDDAAERAIALARKLRGGDITPCPETCSRDGCAYPGICRWDERPDRAAAFHSRAARRDRAPRRRSAARCERGCGQDLRTRRALRAGGDRGWRRASRRFSRSRSPTRPRPSSATGSEPGCESSAPRTSRGRPRARSSPPFMVSARVCCAAGRWRRESIRRLACSTSSRRAGWPARRSTRRSSSWPRSTAGSNLSPPTGRLRYAPRSLGSTPSSARADRRVPRLPPPGEPPTLEDVRAALEDARGLALSELGALVEPSAKVAQALAATRTLRRADRSAGALARGSRAGVPARRQRRGAQHPTCLMYYGSARATSVDVCRRQVRGQDAVATRSSAARVRCALCRAQACELGGRLHGPRADDPRPAGERRRVARALPKPVCAHHG